MVEKKTKTYYLKANRDHSYIKDGVLRIFNKVNDEVELTEEGYEAFKDKFNEEPVKVAAPKEEAPTAEEKPAAPAAPADKK